MSKISIKLTEDQAWNLVGVIQDAYENSQSWGEADEVLKIIFDKFPAIKEEFGDMLEENNE